jgi:hypothetical protein
MSTIKLSEAFERLMAVSAKMEENIGEVLRGNITSVEAHGNLIVACGVLTIAIKRALKARDGDIEIDLSPELLERVLELPKPTGF